MMSNKNQPVLTATVVTTTVAAVLTLLTAFGIPLTDEQTGAINGLIAVLAPVIVGIIAIRTSTSDNKIVEVEDGGVVVAGAANEMVTTGEVVREFTNTSEVASG